MTSYPSQSSEELSNSETPSAIGPCMEDDKEFIRNARARTMAEEVDSMIKSGGRVTLLWEALRELPSSLRQRVFLELLQGSDDGDDIWLWNEGDEALMEWEEWEEEEDWWDSVPWTSAAAALERRLAQTPAQTLRRRKVQCAAFEMRAAVIVWLALTSAAYKSADEERGVRDREEWDMRDLIENWYWGLTHGVRPWSDQHRKSYDDRAFTKAMDQDGHSCHKQREEEVTCWLFMRSELLPAQQDSIIHFGDKHCAPCLAHKPIPGPESPPSWTPSCALVALRFIWDSTQENRDEIEESRDFSRWLSHQPIYGIKEANEFLRSLPRDTDGNKYLPWVNAYPRCLRYTVTGYTLVEWKAMDDCITTSERGGSLNIRSWCAAMCWMMIPDDLSHSIRVKQFIDALHHSGLERWDFFPPPTPAPEFRDTIRVSGHTCWEEPQMDDYATAMAFLYKETKVVGVDVRKYSGCDVCHLQWRLRSLGENLPVEEPAFEVDLTELLFSLRTECSRRKVAWSEISTSAQKKFINSGFSDFSEEAESSDAGTDDDEAYGEDERASVISRADSLDGSEESEDGDGGSDDDEACRVDERASVISRTDSLDGSEESEDGDGGSDHDDASRVDERASVVLIHQSHDNTARHGENNSRPGSPTYHLSGPVISRSFPDNNSESSVRGDPPRSFALVLHDGEVSRPMYDPPTVNPAQLTLHNVRYSGSNIEESTFEAPNLNMAQNVERDENLTRSMGMSVRDLVDNVPDHHQQGMYYMVPPTSSTSHPAHWGESSSNVDPNLEQSMQPVLPARTSTNIDNTPYFTQFKETTLQPVIPSKRNHRTMTSGDISPPADFIQLPPTQKMICEIKKFFTDAMEGHGIHLQYKRNEPKLPWIDFKSTLKASRVRMENWPAGLEEPGRGLSNHPTKGIAGVKPGDLATIYRAIHHPTKPLRLIPDGPSGSNTMLGDSGAGPSPKRRRGDSDDRISRPKHHHGVPMHFDRSSDS